MNKDRSRNTRKIATMGILASLSVVLVFFIRFPIFPSAAYLEYDPADIPILVANFVYGPVAGLIVTVIASVVQGFTVSAQSGIYGIIMHIISTSTFVITAGLIYRRKHNRIGAAIGLCCGVLLSAAVMIPANLFITPLFTGAPVEFVQSILFPVIIPFNLIKAGLNGLITFILYKRVSKLIKGKAE